MRGRKPDGAALQAKKGNPGRRKRKTAKPTRSRKRASVEERAAALAGETAPGELTPPATHPKFLADPRLKKALDVWRELEPDLKRLNLLQRLDRHMFAMYCVHMADWIEATRDIHKRGQWKNVRNVNGDMLPRLNPSVKVREIAEKHILDIGARFGLDPANRYKLLRDQAAAPKPPSESDLVDRMAPPAGDGPPAPQENPSPLGLMDDLASPPPGSRPN